MLNVLNPVLLVYYFKTQNLFQEDINSKPHKYSQTSIIRGF